MYNFLSISEPLKPDEQRLSSSAVNSASVEHLQRGQMWNITVQGPSHLAVLIGGGLSRPNCFLISTPWSAKQTCLISKFLSFPTFGTISQNFSPLSAKIENGFKIATLRPPIKIEGRENRVLAFSRGMKMWRIFAFSDVMMQFEILWARGLAPITCHFSHFVSAVPLY